MAVILIVLLYLLLLSYKDRPSLILNKHFNFSIISDEFRKTPIWVKKLPCPNLRCKFYKKISCFRLITANGGKAFAYTVDLGSRHEIYKASEQVKIRSKFCFAFSFSCVFLIK
jgi:hypothetical protein